tara:strand:- start:464 stop:700 length:237 start_codon:yes stop_codon:yes gene_type:complete
MKHTIQQLYKIIEILKRNVKDLELQLKNQRIRNKKLSEALHFEKASNNPHESFTTATGWAMAVENPDASHIEENKDEG